MLRNDAFAQADVLELANFMHNCGYEDLLQQDSRNIQPGSYVTFWRKDDVQVCNDLEEVRMLAQAIYEGSHVLHQVIPLSNVSTIFQKETVQRQWAEAEHVYNRTYQE